jgi:lysozyme
MDQKTLALLVVGAALVYAATHQPEGDQDEDIIDSTLTKFDELTVGENVNDNMQTSGGMLDMLKRREALALTRYALGDGGYTWGYGHFSTNPDALPVTITRTFAEQLFASDVTARAEKWVKLYVLVPLAQNEFDALVSIAYNMSPQSFKKFAASVNRGDGIDAIAQESVTWVAAKFTNGIANRRAAELAVFNEGIYA